MEGETARGIEIKPIIYEVITAQSNRHKKDMLKCYYRPTASLQLNNKRNTKYNITVT